MCTVVVRTILNPLELVKTKQQLGNDRELFDFVRKQSKAKEVKEKLVAKPKDKVKPGESKESDVGTIDIIKSSIELRGFESLFQAADITFLASCVFGSFGFGATELFRRSFAQVFFSGSEDGSEIILLLAAALATVVTASVATPFEVLRVRSMGTVKPMKWTSVLQDFLVSRL